MDKEQIDKVDKLALYNTVVKLCDNMIELGTETKKGIKDMVKHIAEEGKDAKN